MSKGKERASPWHLLTRPTSWCPLASPQTWRNRTEVPADLSLLWVKSHMPATNLLVIHRFSAQFPQALHSQHSHSSQHLRMSSNYCRLHQGKTQENLPILSRTLHVWIPWTVSCNPRSQRSLQLWSPPCSKHKALKWRPALAEHDQLLSQTENTSVLPWHLFPLSFQSLFHQRDNMRASKFLPLKSYTKTFSDGTPEIRAAGRSHTRVCGAGHFQGGGSDHSHLLRQGATTRQPHLRTLCGFQHLKPRASAQHNRGMSFHELFNPSLLHSF